MRCMRVCFVWLGRLTREVSATWAAQQLKSLLLRLRGVCRGSFRASPSVLIQAVGQSRG